MPALPRRIVLALVLIAALVPARPARAFTTRVHIVLANDVVESLTASGDGTIRLRWSEHSVQIPQGDADAIVAQPLAFRAGAIGPDNTVFPAMTDGTHAVEQDPYRQCEMLYQEAFTQAERAYALGCYLHGSTDAIAHHFVNHFTGETFTLNPITEGRGESYDNVVGHIVTESLIQTAIYESDPAAFSASSLDHTIPQDFVLRTYFDVDSPLWQRMARHPLQKWAAAQAADPDGNLTSWASSADFSPWEHVAMAPQYVEELQRMREGLRTWMVSRIAELASRPSIMAMPGPDGAIGTPDDDTACSASCPAEFGEYWVLVHLLAPRFDTRGNPLPSAFDKISEDLGDNLQGFVPAFVQVIANVSAQLNAPITDAGDHGLDLDASAVEALFAPVDGWASRTFAIDWTAAGMAVSPEWYSDLSLYLSMFGVSITVPDILAAIFQPIVDEIRDALINQVRERAEVFVRELKDQYDAQFDTFRDAVNGDLDASAPPALGGHALDHVQDSGLLAHAFNLTAAALANHEVLLVATDPIENGPTSFDASYTPEWTQLGLCDYLRDAVFPYGTGLRPLLSVQQGATIFQASIDDDSPVECHDGALASFGTASRTSCAHTSLDALLIDPHGSLSRAYPPAHAAGAPACRGLVVPGLPDPPPMPDGGPGALDGGIGTGDGGTETPGTGGGCCSVAARPDRRGSAGLWLMGLLGLVLAARRRGRRLAAVALVAALALVAGLAQGCGDGTTADDDARSADEDAGSDAGEGPLDAGLDATAVDDAGPDVRTEFLDALDGTVWNALQTRIEGGVELERGYELHFRGGAEPMWGEIRNPYGPARQRVRRFVRIARGACVDASRCEITTTVSIPDATWETPETLRGRMETWTVEIIPGTPRALAVTGDDGIEEIFTEGAWPAPTRGLTAEVRVFEGGDGNPVSDAFCTSGGDLQRMTMWDFARGESDEPTLARDVVAGAQLGTWVDVANRFGIRDIDGFDGDTLGGSERTDQFYFVVRYRGVVAHPGGTFQMRELADQLEDAVWVFAGDTVGSVDEDDLFLEVHNFVWADATPDEPSISLPAGDVPVEIIVPRCEMQFEDPFELQLRLGAGVYSLLDGQPIRPLVDDTLFPPVL